MKKEVRIGLALLFGLVAFFLKVPFLYILAWALAGYDVIKQAFVNLKNQHLLAEHFLMSLATIGALFIGEYMEAALVMILYQIGDILEDRAVDSSQESILSLMDLAADFAYKLEGEERIKISPEEIKIGDILEIRAGEKIPVDGEIIQGESYLDQLALTGESKPRFVEKGDEILSGSINGQGRLLVKAIRLEEDSTAQKIMDLLEEATENEAKTQSFITKFSTIYTPIVVLLAILVTFLPPLLFQEELKTWLYRGLSFLVISCPCSFVIGVPMAFISGIGRASKAGILIRGGQTIEKFSQVRSIAFDKTGTLTKGNFKLQEVKVFSIKEEEAFSLAKGLELGSKHPIGQAILDYPDYSSTSFDKIENLPGRGLKGIKEGKIYILGNKRFMEEEGVKLPCDLPSSAVHLAEISPKKTYMAYFLVKDQLKDGAKKTMDLLFNRGIHQLFILSGDEKAIVEEIAMELGIENYYGELLPQDKMELFIKQQNKEKMAFVGDGLNDAPVLKLAHVGITMGGIGSDAAIAAGDVVILEDKLEQVAEAYLISKKTMQIAIENIVFSLFVKSLFLILSALGLLPMVFAVFADVGVTLLCVANCLRIFQMKGIEK